MAALVAAAAGCDRREAGRFPNASLLLVSIDTLRADRLPAYGYAAGSTPHLDALAREGIVFEDAYSHCPLTLPAHASMFTGLLPPRHGVRDNAGFALDPARRTLAERLRKAGWATGAAVSSYVMRRATGIGHGFDFYDDQVPVDTGSAPGQQQRDGAAAVEGIATWIEAGGGRPFFAFAHLYEPHAPYTPPPSHRGHAHPYDGEVSYADELVGRLIGRMRTSGVLERTVVVVTSDHGEGLGDHGESEHGLFVYRESVRVPWILRLPEGRRAGTRVSGLVAQVDLPATLLDLLGEPADGMDGTSQRAALDTGHAEPRPVYSETLFPRYHFGWSELRAVSEDRLRYIDAPRPELYDVRDDPRETRNLVASRVAAAAAMKAWLDRQDEKGPPPAPAPVAPDVRERLEALGYVGRASPAAAAGSRADPKDKVAAYEAYRAGTALIHARRDGEAVAALEAVLAESPGMLDAREALGLALFREGRTKGALAALEAVVAADPDRASAHLALARIHALAGRRDRVERHAALAAAGDPGRAFEALAQALVSSGRVDEAARFARRALEADPDRAAAHVVLGIAAQGAGRCGDALAHYQRADDARRRQKGLVLPGLQARRGDCLAREGRQAEAERAFLDEIAFFPHSAQGRVGLAMLYRSQGRDAEARDVLAGVVTHHPQPGAEEYWTVVRTLAGLGDVRGVREWAAQGRARFPDDPRFRAR
jgi:arylsulfatase A-like enzyme/Tfp pilus assembly protein PilF